jgi:hypothetical protein
VLRRCGEVLPAVRPGWGSPHLAASLPSPCSFLKI